MSDYKGWEQLSPKVYRQWIHDNQIVVYKILDGSRESVDTWVNTVVEILKATPPERPYLAVYDIASVLTMTPYARQRSQEIVNAGLHLEGRYALVLSSSVVAQVIRLFVRREIDRQNRRFARGFFKTQQEAIQWLLEES
jgi:hypothetical protein